MNWSVVDGSDVKKDADLTCDYLVGLH